MKFFVCSSVETSDDDHVEEVSEEDSQEDSEEDETDTDDSNFEENASDNTNNEKTSEAKATDGRKINKSSGNSAESSSSEAETSFKVVTGKQKFNDVKEEQMVKGPEFNVSKSSSKTNSVANGVSLPARLKNVSTEIMVLAALRSLNERGGSSAIAIKKYILNNYPQLEGPRTLRLIKTYIKKALASGKLVQSKGTGLGGSFKVSPGTNRLEEQKQRQNRQKLVKKLKSDQVKAADKVKKNSKVATKNVVKGEIKSVTGAKNTKAKISKSSVKVIDESESATEMPKVSAAVQNTLKVSVPKPAKKAAKAKDAKETFLANDNPVKKTKVDSSIKKSNKKNKSAAPDTVEEKGKTATAAKKKATAKGKTTTANIEMGAGDADAAKLIKKRTVKKFKAK